MTPLMQRQIKREIEFIHENIDNFHDTFFPDPEYKLTEQPEEESMFISFSIDFVFAMKRWLDNNEDLQEQTLAIMYEDYNQWVEGLVNVQQD